MRSDEKMAKIKPLADDELDLINGGVVPVVVVAAVTFGKWAAGTAAAAAAGAVAYNLTDRFLNKHFGC